MSLLYIAADTLQKTFILEKMGQLQGNIIDNFTSWLGRVSCDPALRKEIELPQGVQRAYSPEDLCEKVFPAASMAGIDPHSDFFASRAILAVRNADLSSFNTKLLERLPGEQRTYFSAEETDTGLDANGYELHPREFLQGIDLPDLPPSTLQLKVGAPVILLKDLTPSEGLYKGARLVVDRLGQHIISVRILTGKFKGNDYPLPRLPLHSQPGELPFKLTRRQFPFRLCFAMDINKSQGQSLETVGLDLNSAFSHGQLLSRVTDVRRLIVHMPEG